MAGIDLLSLPARQTTFGDVIRLSVMARAKFGKAAEWRNQAIWNLWRRDVCVEKLAELSDLPVYTVERIIALKKQQDNWEMF